MRHIDSVLGLSRKSTKQDQTNLMLQIEKLEQEGKVSFDIERLLAKVTLSSGISQKTACMRFSRNCWVVSRWESRNLIESM